LGIGRLLRQGAAGVHRYISARGDDAIERRSIDDEVLDDREAPGAERLDRDRLAVPEAAHVHLAGRGALVGAVRDAVDHQAAAAADPLAAIRVERDRIVTLLDQRFVDDIEHARKDMSGCTLSAA
jgi:hypothetical protein